MATPMRTVPVEDSVPKVGNELAVGEDLSFQRKWWVFERIVWTLFVLVVVLDVAGVFGRGPAANAHMHTPDGAMNVRYERIERFSTPSIMTIEFGRTAVRDGKIQLWVSDSIVKELGNQRIVPQPLSSITGDGGIYYTFPTTDSPDSVEFALQPSKPGVFHFSLRVQPNTATPGTGAASPAPEQLQARVVVMP
ncbi:MAG TPA: hypothetical protein VGD59_12235 [Acidisarcina sp.]